MEVNYLWTPLEWFQLWYLFYVFALHFEIGHICGQNGAFGAQDRRQNRSFFVSVFVSIFVFAFVFVFSLNSPRLVTLVVKEVQVAEVHLAANTEGNIVPSESEYVPVQAVAVGSERQTVKFWGIMCIAYIMVGWLCLNYSLTTSISEVKCDDG